MTTQRAFEFTVGMDARDVFMTMDRIEHRARQASRVIANIGGRAGRGGAGIGQIVGAGAGLGAGAAIFEQFFERLFALFEDTPVMEQFIKALDGIFEAAGPLVGVLLQSLTPVLKALTPVIGPLAEAFAPLVELLGNNLLVAVQLLTPLIIPLAKGIGFVTRAINEGLTQALQFFVDQLNRLPFVDINIELPKANTAFAEIATQLETNTTEANMTAPALEMVATAVATVGETAERTGLQQFKYADSQRLVEETTAEADARLAAYANRLRIAREAAEEAAAGTITMGDALAELGAKYPDLVGQTSSLVDEFDLMEGSFAGTGTAIEEVVESIDEVATAATEAVEPFENVGTAVNNAAQAAADGARIAAEAAQAAVDARVAAQNAANAAAQERSQRQNEAYREGGNYAAAVDARRQLNIRIARAIGVSTADVENLFDSEDQSFLGADAILRALGLTRNDAARFGSSGTRAGFLNLFEAIEQGIRTGSGSITGREGRITVQIRDDTIDVGRITLQIGDDTIDVVTDTSEQRRASE